MVCMLISVRLHDGRYHGIGDNPPSPARLFQALVAGCGIGGPLSDKQKRSLQWLEGLDPPLIASPLMKAGQKYTNYLPNNDLDAKGGDRRRIGKIRTVKQLRPRLFDAKVPFLYAWTFDADEFARHHAATIYKLAERLYQFGRGWDMAWAWGEELTEAELARRLLDFPGAVYRATGEGAGKNLRCPTHGTLESLLRRYSAHRFQAVTSGRRITQLYSHQPKPRFQPVPYNSPAVRCLYELREQDTAAKFASWPLERVAVLVESLRDAAKRRLQESLPAQKSRDIERVLVGRKANVDDAVPTSLRIRIVPLPSIGHRHADHDIRRVLVEVPSGCPLRAVDVDWAFAGLELEHPVYGTSIDVTPTEAHNMLKHYGVDGRHRVWRSVTPVALPRLAARRRIDPSRDTEQAKSATERRVEQERASAAVFQALRHVQIRSRLENTYVQREPFESNGQLVDAFVKGTRFSKERLWHVQIKFGEPVEVQGPLVVGDGRFLGLGIMAPNGGAQAIHSFVIEKGLGNRVHPIGATRALRRAVMARVQQQNGGTQRLQTFYTGHNSDGSIARDERHQHLTYIFDPRQKRFLVVAPHMVARRSPKREERLLLSTLDIALTGFRELRAGSMGRLTLTAVSVDTDSDRLFARSTTWTSVTQYQVTRHKKGVTASEAVTVDVQTECERQGLPMPRVTTIDIQGVRNVGLLARLKLEFDLAVKGPITLGRSRHLGGGLFEAIPA